MKIVIIGGVAAGTSAAAKARRNNEEAEIIIYEKDRYISYSGCGMPYYIGGEVKEQRDLFPRDPEFFKSKYNVDIMTQHEVLAVNTHEKELEVKNLVTGEVFADSYDKLLFATGAIAVVPQIFGVGQEHVFVLRNILDMQKIKAFIEQNKPQNAVIVGSGFVGMEVCENLIKQGVKVTIIKKLSQLSPWIDRDMSTYLRNYLEKNGIQAYTGVTVKNIEKSRVVLSDNMEIEAELVLLASGICPNTALAEKTGIQLGVNGAIQVKERLETNLPDIYACGDCAEVFNLITGKPMFCPLGSTANKMGRIAGDVMTGGSLTFRGVLGTGIFKIFDLTVAKTGLSEQQAIEAGYEVAVCHNIKPNKPEYMQGKEMVIKAVADRKSGRLLGVQIIGYEGVDKRIDIFVTAMTYGAKAEDLFHLDLAYAPPYATTKDPVHYTGMILDNAINHSRRLITAGELHSLIKSGERYVLIDTRTEKQYAKGHIESSQNIPLAKLRDTLNGFEKDTIVITYCNKGVTGNAAQNILMGYGFEKVFNLSGGYKNYSIVYPDNK